MMILKTTLFTVLFFILSGCQQIKVEPVLSSSLGITAFQNMEKIQLHDVSLALYLDDKIKNLIVEKEIRAGKFKFEVGNALSVKLIKALTYTFRTVHLVKKPSYAGPEKIDAMMLVTLQDVDMNLDVKIGFASVETESYSRFAIRAEIKDMESKDTVWVGTTQAQTTGKHEEMAKMTYQEAGRGFAVGIDMAIDKVVGNLVRQMEKSQSLSSHLKIWEQKT